MRIRDFFIIAVFLLATGAATVAVPHYSFAVLGIASVLPLLTFRAFRLGAVGALVFVPTWSFFSSNPADNYSIAAISEKLEEGDPVRQIAISLLFLIGLAFLGWNRREVHRVNLSKWIAIYIAFAVASLFWSQDRLLTIRASIVAIAVAVFSMGIGCVYFGQNRYGHIHLIRAICWTCTAASLWIMVLAIYQGNVHVFDLTWRLGSGGHENQLSEVAAVGLLAALATRQRIDIWPARALWLFAIAIPALVVLFTKSRTTWLGLTVGILIVELFRRRQMERKVAIILIMGCALGVILALPSFESFWTRGGTSETGTLSSRTEIWEAIWPRVNERFWLGHGYHAFWTPETVEPMSDKWVPTSAHNGYLEMVAELGGLGLATVLILVIVSSRNAWQLTKYREYHTIALYLLGLNAMQLVIATASDFLSDIDYYPMIVLLIASIFVSHRLSLLRSATYALALANPKAPVSKT